MNLQQLRYLCAIVDHGLNVSDAAGAQVVATARQALRAIENLRPVGAALAGRTA